MTWLNENIKWFHRGDDYESMEKADKLAGAIRELVGYVTFLEGYCKIRMPPDKARQRFCLPAYIEELLE